MLRITVVETATEQRWTLEGRLVGPWVAELGTCWENRHRAQNGRGCTVDLSAVTAIDEEGQELLRTMSNEHARFVVTGDHIKYVLEESKPNGRCGLLRRISRMFVGFRELVNRKLFYQRANPEVLKRTRATSSAKEADSTDRKKETEVASVLAKTNMERRCSS